MVHKCSAVLEIGNHFATIDMGKKEGGGCCAGPMQLNIGNTGRCIGHLAMHGKVVRLDCATGTDD